MKKPDLFVTGAGFKSTYNRSGAPSLRKKLTKVARFGEYKNFSKGDIKFVTDTIKGSEKSIRRKGYMGKYAIKKAGKGAYQAYKEGKISKIDYQKAKKIYKGFSISGQKNKTQQNKVQIIPTRYNDEEITPMGTINSIINRKTIGTNSPHGATSVSDLLNKSKTMPTLKNLSPKPPSRNFGLKI